MANSFKQMFKEGVIKRPDGRMLIRLDDIHIIDGFNPRDYNSAECKEADEGLFQHLMAGGSVPALEVKALDPSGVWIVEGHRRYRCYQRLRDSGQPVEWISIVQFKGSDIEAQAHVMKSNNQLALSPLEKATNLKRLAAFNLSLGEIANLVGLSVPTVEKLLALSEADHAVQQKVKNNEVSVDVALSRIEEFGGRAAEVLEQDKAVAAAAGRKKVTRSVIAPEISVKKARRLVELITLAGIDESGTISLSGELLNEVQEIITEQRDIEAQRSRAAA
ncbi:chromosome partitioning protein ParB [Klebsiella oxytoca]|uniref:ParB/RepB/Spo0J family partition protein n=1 Tax=Klebsiella TaxID=570 RepID=UPI0018C60CAA|nr:MULTISPECIES: chromosome partitioning protein ParB [Klebsiella]MBG2577069.1 chromosome partitioning protein ParB [Klebsiella oxytoca]MBZ7405062.1 chromosome partitioning protein ParB [Klebsiella grimontii]MCW9606706.1 chromosome partitioning protein ParB [Klebsiella oxytoca]MCW9673633.1 chromosome partitioning protein ParB [Klebsiella oxytoca]MDL5432882.1 chromosome partitioning protein ParB [Klebsiella michiganensis]